MTPEKEEAIRLVKEFSHLHLCNECGGAGREIESALICVNEIIREKRRILEDMNKLFDEKVKPVFGYLQKVKREIQKL